MSREPDEEERRHKVAIEPTIPATDVRSGVPDFSSERRPAESAPGGATVWVIVALVVAVGALFWWLGGTRAQPTPTPATTPPTAATTAAPSSKPAAAKPAAAKPAAAKPAAAAKPTPPPAATPPAAATTTTTTTTAPATDAQSPSAAATPPHKHASKKRHKKPPASKHKEVKLPRLPTPPPPTD
jgi:cytoskeletal protein RodZ